MGIGKRLVDYRLDLPRIEKAIIINDINISTESQKQYLSNAVKTVLNTTDNLTLLPQCSCGELKGERVVGLVCNQCLTKVSKPLTSVEPLLWARKPHGVEALINIKAFTTLMTFFEKGKFYMIQWICDVSYKPNKDLSNYVVALELAGIQRGYNYFVKNFDEIIEKLLNLKIIIDRYGKTKKTISPLDEMREWVKMNRGKIFTDYLPIINKALIIIENKPLGIYADPMLPRAVEAIKLLVGIDTELNNSTENNKQSKTIKMILELYQFNIDVEKEMLGSKEGILRKHLFGFRTHFSFRAVISSLTGKHEYDEIKIPWTVGIEVFRLHLINKLIKLEYTHKQITKMLFDNEKYFHPITGPIINKLFIELIKECPFKGIPVEVGRNPTMERGSMQRLYITSVKTDVKDPTFGISILIVKTFNADFDGDALNAEVLLDVFMHEGLAPLAPHTNIISPARPKAMSGSNAIPKPAIYTISNWMSTKESADPVKLNRMKALLT